MTRSVNTNKSGFNFSELVTVEDPLPGPPPSGPSPEKVKSITKNVRSKTKNDSNASAKPKKVTKKQLAQQAQEQRLASFLDGDMDALPESKSQEPVEQVESKAPTITNTETQQLQISNDDLDKILEGAVSRSKEPKTTAPTITIPKSKSETKEAKETKTKRTNITTNPDTKEQDEKKQNILLALRRYNNSQRFGTYLQENGFKLEAKTLPRKSIEELESILNRVRFAVANKGDGTFSDVLLKKMFVFAETVITKQSGKKANLTGLQQTLWQNEQFLDDLECLKLEYLSFAYVDYKYRLLGTIIQTAMTVNYINTHGMPLSQRPNVSSEIPLPTNTPLNADTPPKPPNVKNNGVETKFIPAGTDYAAREAVIEVPSFDD